MVDKKVYFIFDLRTARTRYIPMSNDGLWEKS